MKGDVYPSWRYHATLEAKICKSAKEDEILGDEWSDTPATFLVQDEAPAEKPKRKKKAEEPAE